MSIPIKKIPLSHIEEIPTGGIQSIQEGDGISIDNSDPENPIISAIDLGLNDVVTNGNTTYQKVNLQGGVSIYSDLEIHPQVLGNLGSSTKKVLYNPNSMRLEVTEDSNGVEYEAGKNISIIDDVIDVKIPTISPTLLYTNVSNISIPFHKLVGDTIFGRKDTNELKLFKLNTTTQDIEEYEIPRVYIYSIDLDDEGNFFYANDGTGNIYKFNTSTLEESLVGNGGSNYVLDILVDGELVYSINGNKRLVYRFLPGGTRITLGPVGTYPMKLTKDRVGNIFINCDQGLYRIAKDETSSQLIIEGHTKSVVFDSNNTMYYIKLFSPTKIYRRIDSGLGPEELVFESINDTLNEISTYKTFLVITSTNHPLIILDQYGIEYRPDIPPGIYSYVKIVDENIFYVKDYKLFFFSDLLGSKLFLNDNLNLSRELEPTYILNGEKISPNELNSYEFKTFNDETILENQEFPQDILTKKNGVIGKSKASKLDYSDIADALKSLSLVVNPDGSLSLVDKQDKLISGANIKTLNGSSLLGSGDLSEEFLVLNPPSYDGGHATTVYPSIGNISGGNA